MSTYRPERRPRGRIRRHGGRREVAQAGAELRDAYTAKGVADLMMGPELLATLTRMVEKIAQPGGIPDLVWAEGRWHCRHTRPAAGCRGCAEPPEEDAG